jgi:hypothetical protein
MKTVYTSSRRIPRRELLQLAGAGGLAVVLAGVLHVVPSSVLAATDTTDESPEAFLARAYAERARAMTSGDRHGVDALYGGNARLLAHEQDRVAFMYDAGPRWNGTIVSYEASVQVIELQANAATATGRVYEVLQCCGSPLQGLRLQRKLPCADRIQQGSPQQRREGRTARSIATWAIDTRSL